MTGINLIRVIRVILHTLFIFSGVQASMARNVVVKSRNVVVIARSVVVTDM